jgi:hypothetical protein
MVWPHLPICLFWAASFPLQAATSTQTNQEAILYTQPSLLLEGGNPIDEVLMDRFSHEIFTSDSIVFDRFVGPSSQLGWVRIQNRVGYGSLERFNSAGANMFATIGTDSLRTAIVGALPLEAWQDNWQGWLGSFITGTIGNVEEEHVELASASYSAVRSSWEDLNRDASFEWGFRPWRANPYFYFLAQAGHFEGRPLVTLEGRTGYTLLGSTKTEGRLSFQLPASFRLAAGAAFDPARMGSEDHGAAHFAVTLEKVLRSHGLIPDAVFFIGFRSGLIGTGSSSDRQRENLFLAGFTKRW